jgi:hypothetical protein
VTVSTSSPSLSEAAQAPLAEGYSSWEPPTLARKHSTLGLSEAQPDRDTPEDDDAPDGEPAARQTPEDGDATEAALDTVVPVTGLASLRLRARQFWRPGARTLVLFGAAVLALGAGALQLLWLGSEPPARPAASPVSSASSASLAAKPTTKPEVPLAEREPEVPVRQAPAQKAEGLQHESEASCDADSGPKGTECMPASTVEQHAQPAAAPPVHYRSRHQSARARAKKEEPPCRDWGI